MTNPTPPTCTYCGATSTWSAEHTEETEMAEVHACSTCDQETSVCDEEVRNGVVVDRNGRVLGLLTLRAVMDWMQDDRSRDVPEDIAEAVADAVVVEDADAVDAPV